MKTQRQSTRLALGLDAEEATMLWLDFEDGCQDQRGANCLALPSKFLQINDSVDCAGSLDLTCMKCDISLMRVSVAEPLHNPSPYSWNSTITVSAEAWHAII